MPVQGLWVPPSADPLIDARRQIDAERQALADEQIHELLTDVRHMNAELRRIDPYLELVLVGDRAPGPSHPDYDPAIVPGRWHVVRHNPDAPDTWMPVTGHDGSYTEPTSRIFDRLAEGDMWTEEYGNRQRRRAAKAAAEKQRARDNRREQQREEFVERYHAATRTQISMNTSTPWSQNHAGQRAAKAAAAKREKAA
jgi:hypothetical protein